MKYNEYSEKRNALLDEAQVLIDEGKTTEANEKMAEINELDNSYEEATKQIANLNALKEANKGKGLGVVASEAVDSAANNKKATYTDAFANYLLGKNLSSEEKTVFDSVNYSNAVQTADTHAVLIPETMKEGIWAEIAETHAIYADTAPTFVKGNLTIVKESNAALAAWYDEDNSVVEDDLTTGTITLKGCELAKDITVSWKLKKMAAEDFIAYIQKKLAEKMGNALAAGIATGTGVDAVDGKDQPTGVITAIEAEENTPQLSTYSEAINYSDIVGLFAKIKSGYKKVIYAKSSTIWNGLAMVLDNNGRPIFVPNEASDSVGRIFGAVVKEEDAIPEGAILVGDMANGYAININEDVTMHLEDHVKERSTDYMAYALVDGMFSQRKRLLI